MEDLQQTSSAPLSNIEIHAVIRENEAEREYLENSVMDMLDELHEVQNRLKEVKGRIDFWKRKIYKDSSYDESWSWQKKAVHVLANDSQSAGMSVNEIIEKLKLMEPNLNMDNARIGITNSLNRLGESIGKTKPLGAPSHKYFLKSTKI